MSFMMDRRIPPTRQEKYAGINLKQDNCMDASKAFAIDANDNSTGRSRVPLCNPIILRGRHHPLS
jgi:hypothetical protein